MRMRFLYASPDGIRFEQLGNRGMLQVADGENVRTSFPQLPMGNGPRYSSMPASRMPFHRTVFVQSSRSAERQRFCLPASTNVSNRLRWFGKKKAALWCPSGSGIDHRPRMILIGVRIRSLLRDSLSIERRLSFSAAGTQLRVGERIIGPKGTVEG
jgi:hypothetical protein